MRQDKIKAINVRRVGKSYREIEKILGIPRSTLSGWFQKIQWSRKVKEKLSLIARRQSSQRMIALLEKINKERQKLYRSTKRVAKNQFKKLKKDSLFIAGLMIYWGEGDNKLENGVIRVCNTDPVMLKLFYFFIKTYLQEISHKIKAYLILYPDLDEEECKNFWSKNTGIPIERFIKSTYIHGHHPTNRLRYGICTITITNRAYKEKIHTWINLMRSKVVKMRV